MCFLVFLFCSFCKLYSLCCSVNAVLSISTRDVLPPNSQGNSKRTFEKSQTKMQLSILIWEWKNNCKCSFCVCIASSSSSSLSRIGSSVCKLKFRYVTIHKSVTTFLGKSRQPCPSSFFLRITWKCANYTRDCENGTQYSAYLHPGPNPVSNSIAQQQYTFFHHP